MTRRAELAGDLGPATINPGDRVAIIGRSGTGKSVLLRSLMSRYSTAVLLDPKRTADFGGWAHLEGARDFGRDWPRHHPRAIARPGLLEDERTWADAVCRRIYTVGRCAAGLDELPAGVSESRPLVWLDVLLKRGRELGITTYVATQRPRRIPLDVIAQAEHVFVFDLNNPSDVAFMADTLGAYDHPRTPHGFWYWRPGLTGARECRPLIL